MDPTMMLRRIVYAAVTEFGWRIGSRIAFEAIKAYKLAIERARPTWRRCCSKTRRAWETVKQFRDLQVANPTTGEVLWGR